MNTTEQTTKLTWKAENRPLVFNYHRAECDGILIELWTVGPESCFKGSITLFGGEPERIDFSMADLRTCQFLIRANTLQKLKAKTDELTAIVRTL